MKADAVVAAVGMAVAATLGLVVCASCNSPDSSWLARALIATAVAPAVGLLAGSAVTIVVRHALGLKRELRPIDFMAAYATAAGCMLVSMVTEAHTDVGLVMQMVTACALTLAVILVLFSAIRSLVQHPAYAFVGALICTQALLFLTQLVIDKHGNPTVLHLVVGV